MSASAALPSASSFVNQALYMEISFYNRFKLLVTTTDVLLSGLGWGRKKITASS